MIEVAVALLRLAFVGWRLFCCRLSCHLCGSEGPGNRKMPPCWTFSLDAEPETGRARQLMAEDRLPPQVDVFNQPVVTIVQSLRIVELVPRVVVQHFFWITCGGSVVFDRSLIEVLLVISELEQQRNGRRVPNEMDGIDVARNLSVLFQLACRLVLAEIDHTRIV